MKIKFTNICSIIISFVMVFGLLLSTSFSNQTVHADSQEADLSVSVTVNDSTPGVGDTIIYTVSIINNGPDAATGVTVFAALPPGLTYLSATFPQGVFNSMGLWTVGDLGSANTLTLRIMAKVTSPSISTFAASVLYADPFDPDPSNNLALCTITSLPSQDANLSSLTLSSGTLSPLFASGTTDYTVNVANSVNRITVTPTTNELKATMTVNGTATTSGLGSEINLNAGSNPITIVVTAQDGVATKTYTLTVNRNPLAVPEAPTDVTATPGDAQATVTFLAPADGGGSAITDYTVTSIPGGILATGTDSPITITGLTNGTEYTFTVTARNAAGNSAASSASNRITPNPTTFTVSFNSNGGSAVDSQMVSFNGIATEPTAPTKAGYTFDGWYSDAAYAAKYDFVNTPITGNTTIYAKWTEKVDSSPSSGGGTSVPTVVQPVSDSNAQPFNPDGIDTTKPSFTLEVAPKNSVAGVSIPADLLTRLESKNPAFIIEIKTPYGSYNIPVNLASLIPGLKDWLATNNLTTKDISFKMTVADKSGNKDIQAAFANGLPNGKVMGVVVDFSIEIVNTRTGQTLGTADKFSKALARLIPMPKDTTSITERWGAFRYNESTKKFEFVPARKIQIDGGWYALVNPNSNSVYVVAQNAVSFADVQKHWSQSYVELAAAKGLIDGVGGGQYEPDQTVTRAEFTAMLVRALGRGTSSGSAESFSDVQQGAWYHDAIAKAKELGLLDFVKGDGFLPNQSLTREEMASMLAAATKLEGMPNTNKLVSLKGYKDLENVDSAYLEDIGLMVTHQIMIGTSADTFSPDGETTRAQAAAVFIRMLKTLEMID